MQVGYYTLSNSVSSVYISDVIEPNITSNDFRIFFNSKTGISNVYYKTDDKLDRFINISGDSSDISTLINKTITFMSNDNIITTAFATGYDGDKLYIEDIGSLNISGNTLVNHKLTSTPLALASGEVYPKGFVFTDNDDFYLIKTPFIYDGNLSNFSEYIKKLNKECTVYPAEVTVHEETVSWIECAMVNVRGNEYQYYPSRISKKGYNNLQIKLELSQNMNCSKLRVITLI